MAKSPAIGQPAPDFTLPGVVLADGAAQRGEFSLAAQRGRPLVLAFYPGDETAVCTKQLCSYSSGLDRFTALDATVWGISPQTVESHENFARHHGLGMPLLADTGLEVASAYGITVGKVLRRAVFLLDGDGVLRWKHVAMLGLTFQSLDTIAEQLRRLEVG
ncbi:peroxiredoxin [Actinospica durhamensis]|uniref:thioredoxin-dependent peroxiredoxin n=1 Tax=Actinospica durhamensis TaxID=1508375 RepID=A0A941EUM4_9ACTN|nr:peroxiredoxin [Actinospica durhamensis]MBR7835359.1 peroxiredoxin [Actinospica durhamensis]